MDLSTLDRKLARAWDKTPAKGVFLPVPEHDQPALDQPAVALDQPARLAWHERYAEIRGRHAEVMKNWRLLAECSEEERWRVLGVVLLGR